MNFGIVYGISSFGLSQDLSISRKEASNILKNILRPTRGSRASWTDSWKMQKEWLCDDSVRKTPSDAGTQIFNFMQRSFGERVAMNAPIQGTAADIIKIAMIHVSERLKKEQLKSRLILQVHDELLIEAEESELEQVKTILREEMQGAAELSVRLEIDMHTGKNWYEAK